MGKIHSECHHGPSPHINPCIAELSGNIFHNLKLGWLAQFPAAIKEKDFRYEKCISAKIRFSMN